MSNRSQLIFPFLLALAAESSPAFAQPPTSVPPASARLPEAATVDVPVRRVSLFSSGVGYFEHVGSLSGDATSALRFKSEQINDVLKSLVLQDLDGGQVTTVAYQSQDPLEKTLGGFQVDLTGKPAISQLLAQLRGADVSVAMPGGRSAVTGRILGVETRKKAVADKAIVDSPTLNLVTPIGIQSFAIDELTSIQLSDARLQQELDQALLAVAASRNSDKKSVTIHFKGTGERRVRMGYVVATPIWKASYRLMISDNEKSALQGWAIVENQTDFDWNSVSLSLVSGRPLSFQMALYDPLYLTRPTARLELFEGLRPQTYAEGRDMAAAKSKRSVPAAAPAPSPSSAQEAVAERRGLLGGSNAIAAIGDESAQQSVVAQASAGKIGELFEYALADITLARQSSAMVPIITDPIDVTPVSIYNSSVLARHPLSGANVRNTTDKHLLQGPITVFQGGGYAGDAQINNVAPGEERLISYGIDLQTLIDADKTDDTSDVMSVRIVKGSLGIQSKTVSARHFAMKNQSGKAKTIVVEQPKKQGWALVDTDTPRETTDTLYRFEQRLGAGEQAELVVKEQTINFSALGILDTDVDTLRYYVSNGKTPGTVKAALQKAIELQSRQVDLDRQIIERNDQLRNISTEQNRIRENMKTIDKASEYYGRLMKKLNDQETQIERLQARIDELSKDRDSKRAALENYLATLDVE